MEIVPAIDIRGGRAVRLEQGDYERETVFDPDPAGVAARWVDAGASRIHVVDLDGARDGSSGNEAVVRSILEAAGDVPVQLGGGIRSSVDIERWLGLGVSRVIVGTAAIEKPDLLHDSAPRHPDRIVLGLDAKDGCVAIHGWQETTGRSVEEVLADFSDLPLGGVLYTDIRRDGMMTGPNVEATARLARMTQFRVIASGGVGSIEDLLRPARERVISAVVVGRALYNGAIDLRQALEEVAKC